MPRTFLQRPAFPRGIAFVLALALLSAAQILAQSATQPAKPYQYFRLGAAADGASVTQAGFALMGGGADLDEAFRWLCNRAGGGDFLVLRASGNDDYNPYIEPLCKLNSVATLILPSRAAAFDPFATQAISHAEAIFIAGGDQANYIRFWKDTPVQTEINAAIRRGVPVGGTSAGLAVLGEWIYSAVGDKPDDPNLDSRTALANPFHPRITLSRLFLNVPILKGTITDSHFVRRDRMGRLLTFLARLGPETRGIGVDERTAALVDQDGRAHIVGKGSVYFLQTKGPAEVLAPEKPLSLRDVMVKKVSAGDAFDLKTWLGETTAYMLSVEKGTIHSTQAGGAIY